MRPGSPEHLVVEPLACEPAGWRGLQASEMRAFRTGSQVAWFLSLPCTYSCTCPRL